MKEDGNEGFFGQHEKNLLAPLESKETKQDKHENKDFFDAIAEIQQLSVIERKAQNQIDPEYFTLKQQVEFLKIGLKTGLIEGLFFMFCFPVLLVLIPAFMMYFYEYKFSIITLIFLNFGGYASIGIVTLFTLNLTRYYAAGKLTQKAIDALLFGRGLALIIKAIVSYTLFLYLYKLSIVSPKTIWQISNIFDVLSHGIRIISSIFGLELLNKNFSQQNYYEFFYIALSPILKKTGNDMLFSLLFAGLSPFLAIIFLKLKGNKSERNTKKLEDY